MPDVAFDAASSVATATGTTRTWTHTDGSGANRLLLAFAFTATSNDWVTGVTYNSVSMTRLGVVTDFSAATVTLYGLLAPATGANSVVITSSNSVSIAGCAYSLSEAKQSLTLDALFSGFNAATTTRLWGPTSTVTDRALVVLFGWNSAEVPVASTNFTNRSVVNKEAFVGDRGAVTTPAGDVYVQQTTTGSTTWLTISVAVAPVPVAGNTRGNMTTLGVG